jgi:hypothetical protein
MSTDSVVVAALTFLLSDLRAGRRGIDGKPGGLLR